MRVVEFRHGWIQGFCYIIRILSPFLISHFSFHAVFWEGFTVSQEMTKMVSRSFFLPSSAASAKRACKIMSLIMHPKLCAHPEPIMCSEEFIIWLG